MKDFLNEKAKLTFLVGAGCSIDAPSCLPAGRAMMDAIIDYVCPNSETKKIKNLKQLRFEALVEIFRDNADKDLKIIDYYGLCDKPNIQHFFFAEMIKKGYFVMTTNFDFLIEYALIHIGVPKDEIIVAITKEDFQKFSNPSKLFNNNKKTLYKIHGSTKNVITELSTKDFLIATMQAFGSNKEGLNIFQIESYKQKLFENITGDRSLIIIGYSGSDDFDVVPTLKVLKNLRNVVWIDFKADDGGREQIFEIDKSSPASDKVNQVLIEMKRRKNADHIYRVKANTSRMIKELLSVEPELSPYNFSINPYNWLKSNIELPHEFFKYRISGKIYNDFGMFEDALRCKEMQLQITEEEEDDAWKAVMLHEIGIIYRSDRKHLETRSEKRRKRDIAMANFLEAFKIYEKIGDLRGKSDVLCSIGKHYPSMMRSRTSTRFFRRRNLIVQKMYEEVLEIDKQLEDPKYLSSKISHLITIAGYYSSEEKFEEALNMLEDALKFYDQQGDLIGKSSVIHAIGGIYYSQLNYKEALTRYELSLQILQQLGLGNDHPNIKAVEDNIKLLKLKEKNKAQPFSSKKIMEEIIQAKAKEDRKKFEKLIKIFDQLKKKVNEKLFSKLHKELLNLFPEYYAVEFYLSYMRSYRNEFFTLKNESGRHDEKTNENWRNFHEELYNKFRMISEKYSNFLEKNKTDDLEVIKASFLIILNSFEPELSEDNEYIGRLRFIKVLEPICEKELMELCISIQRAVYGIRSQEETLFKLILGKNYQEYFDKIF